MLEMIFTFLLHHLRMIWELASPLQWIFGFVCLVILRIVIPPLWRFIKGVVT